MGIMPKTRQFPKVAFTGKRTHKLQYYYHNILTMPLWQFLLMALSIFVVVNVFFASMYAWIGGLKSAQPLIWFDYFYYSVITFATVGYGDILPGTEVVKAISLIEVFCGLLFTGTLTGLIFARFARTPSPFVWAKPLVHFRHEKKHFIQARIANVLGNDVVNVKVRLFLMRTEHSHTGRPMRHLVPLSLEMSYIPIAAFSWVISHEVNKTSPLNHWLRKHPPAQERVIGFIHGFDATVGREVYNYTRWSPEDLRKGEFENVLIKQTEDEQRTVSAEINLDKLDEVVSDLTWCPIN